MVVLGPIAVRWKSRRNVRSSRSDLPNPNLLYVTRWRSGRDYRRARTGQFDRVRPEMGAEIVR